MRGLVLSLLLEGGFPGQARLCHCCLKPGCVIWLVILEFLGSGFLRHLYCRLYAQSSVAELYSSYNIFFVLKLDNVKGCDYEKWQSGDQYMERSGSNVSSRWPVKAGV